MPLRLEPIHRGHRPLLAGFQNRHPALVEYLKRYALRHAGKDYLARANSSVREADGIAAKRRVLAANNNRTECN